MNTTKNDWQELFTQSLTSIDQLSKYIELNERDLVKLKQVTALFPMRISPYTASLMDPHNENCPIRRQFLPSVEELEDEHGLADPLCEAAHTTKGRIIRVYPDRVAVIISARCASFCRFCFRKALFSDTTTSVTETMREAALDAIAADQSIQDVLVTGGDPLLLSNEILENFLRKLRKIKHVQIIRLGTRLLSTWPMRITDTLAAMLARYHPLWLNVHFNHPAEITPQAGEAIQNLLSHGIPISNQSVLLKGINDEPATMMELSRKLLRQRIRPYYLFQCHLVKGTRHFRTPVESGISIMEKMRGRISGLGIPQFTLDTPHGKVPLTPNYLIRRDSSLVRVRTFNNQTWDEYNPLTDNLKPKGQR